MNRSSIRTILKRIVALALVLTFALATTALAVPSLPGSEPASEEPIIVAEDQAEHPVVVTVEPVIIVRDGEVVVRADETGVHILQRVLLTQEEIQSLIPLARTALETRMSPHPNRAMTAEELVAWNLEYDTLGGMNSLELLILYQINEVRAEHNLVPFALCPYLNRASRLHTNLRAEGHTGHGHSERNHHDIFYGHNDPVQGQSARGRAFLFDSTLTDRPRSFIGENTGSQGLRNENRIEGWMNSAGHRGQILNARWEAPHIGIGWTPSDNTEGVGFATTKFNAILGRQYL